MPFPSFEQIKQRKIVQWGLAYLAGAWLALQVVVALASVYSWPAWLLRAVPVVLVVGFFAALVVAWYHGERGRQKVSGLELTLLAGILAIAGLGVMLVADEPEAPAPAPTVAAAALGAELDETAIAVLPLQSVGADSSYLAAGLTEEVQNTLATSPTLRVVATTSSAVFARSDAPADSIGRALGVAHLVEGTVRRAGRRVRVAVRLVSAETGLREWSETYDRDVRDVFALQSEIAQAVAFQLNARIASDRGRGSEDPEAYALALEARQVYEQGADPRVYAPEAQRLFEAALARDSAYAYAWAGLANVLRLSALLGPEEKVEATRARSRAAAERALALDPNEGWAHYALGFLEMGKGLRGAPRAHLERAVAASPNDARALGQLAYVRMVERDEAAGVRAAARAAVLDPLSPEALSVAAYVYSMAGQDDRAIELARRAYALKPEDDFTAILLANILAITGRSEEAMSVLEDALARDPNLATRHLAIPYVYARAGRRADADAQLRRQREDVNYTRAAVEAALGEPDAAFAALARSVEADEPALIELSVDPWFRTLRDDPRWEALLSRVRALREVAGDEAGG